jgi:hypothetical protein
VLENANPQYKWNERPPNLLGGRSQVGDTKVITTVHTELVDNADSLLDFPKWVHGHLTVCSSNIWFPKDERLGLIGGMSGTESSDGIT